MREWGRGRKIKAAAATAVGVSTALGAGCVLTEPAAATPFPPDQRTWVQGSTSAPYNGIGSLHSSNDPGGSFCTVWKVAANRFATAAHCIYSRNSFSYFDAPGDLAIWMGGNINGSGVYKYSSCVVTGRVAHPNYRDPGLSGGPVRQRDIAILAANCDVGGAFEWDMVNPASQWNVAIHGYPIPGPTQPPNYVHERPYIDLDDITLLETNVIEYAVDTSPGNSGSPVWRTGSGCSNGCSHALHNYGDAAFTSGMANQGTRMTAAVQDWLLNTL